MAKMTGESDEVARLRLAGCSRPAQGWRRRPSTRSMTARSTSPRSTRCEKPRSARPPRARFGDTWPGWEDSAVPPEKLGDYLRDLPSCWTRYGYGRRVALRPLRARLRAHQHPVRPDDRRGHRRVPVVRHPGRAPGASLRRVAVRRARRRSGPRRIAGDHVRRRTGAGVRRVQGDLRPGRPDESGQGRRPQPARLAAAPRRRLAAAGTPTQFSYPRRRRLRGRTDAVFRGRRTAGGTTPTPAA